MIHLWNQAIHLSSNRNSRRKAEQTRQPSILNECVRRDWKNPVKLSRKNLTSKVLDVNRRIVKLFPTAITKENPSLKLETIHTPGCKWKLLGISPEIQIMDNSRFKEEACLTIALNDLESPNHFTPYSEFLLQIAMQFFGTANHANTDKKPNQMFHSLKNERHQT
jgi:hypothetical protein